MSKKVDLENPYALLLRIKDLLTAEKQLQDAKSKLAAEIKKVKLAEETHGESTESKAMIEVLELMAKYMEGVGQ
jgi:ferritin-like metal-binding protein YciE